MLELSPRGPVRATMALVALVALVACARPAPTPTPQPAPTRAPATPVPPTAAPPTAARPAAVAPTEVSPTVPPRATASPAELLENVHWLGHAAFRLTGEKTVYIDPYQLKESSPTPADIILITHSHSDHYSPGDVARIRGANTVVVAPADVAEKVGGQVRTVKPGEKLDVAGVTIETVPAYNPDKTYHPRASGWVGYVVTLNGRRIYHAGDTGRIPEMEALRVDVALLPVDGKYTMTALEAAAAANAMRPGVAVPMHWGAVAGTLQDAQDFVAACQVPAQILEVRR